MEWVEVMINMNITLLDTHNVYIQYMYTTVRIQLWTDVRG